MRSVFYLLSLAALCSAAPAPITHAVHEKRESTPSRWVNLGRVDPDSNVVVRVGLAQNNLHKGHDYLMDMLVSSHRPLTVTFSTDIVGKLSPGLRKLWKDLDS